VHVDAETHVVGEIPARVIGIEVEDDVVGIPQPVAAISHIGGRDAEEEAAEPETRRAAADQPPNVPGADGIREASVLPGMVEVVVCVAGTGMADPAAGIGIDMGRRGMTRAIRLAARRQGRVLARAMLRNVSATDLRMCGGRMSLLMLRERGEGKNGNSSDKKRFQDFLHGFLQGLTLRSAMQAVCGKPANPLSRGPRIPTHVRGTGLILHSGSDDGRRARPAQTLGRTSKLAVLRPEFLATYRAVSARLSTSRVLGSSRSGRKTATPTLQVMVISPS
jgi:hypothetical protein